MASGGMLHPFVSFGPLRDESPFLTEPASHQFRIPTLDPCRSMPDHSDDIAPQNDFQVDAGQRPVMACLSDRGSGLSSDEALALTVHPPHKIQTV